MAYYNIKHDTEYGSFEQIKELNRELTREDIELFNNLKLRRSLLPDKMPDLCSFKIAEEAIITDILSCLFLSMNNGFLISDKVINLLNSFAINEHKLFKAKVEGTSISYSYLFLPEEREYINYSESEFIKTKLLNINRGEEIKGITSYNHFVETNTHIQRTEPGSKLSFDKVVLTKTLDIFRLPGDSRILISERLKGAFDKAGITGFNCKLYNP
ncbi:MAG: hypothetical protein N4A72_08870 [Bacteroidales bacterium]|jgi:hypothetical protein|nr:hypothetical protein [Bacteroidales bacterium]